MFPFLRHIVLKTRKRLVFRRFSRRDPLPHRIPRMAEMNGCAVPAAFRHRGICAKVNHGFRWRVKNMAIRVAINGFGRIGRLVFRAAMEHPGQEIEVVGVNDLGPVETNAHLLRYDSVHGRFPHDVTSGENWLDAGRGKVRVTAERDPAKLPWKELGVDVALECTGIFTKREAAAKHLEAGAKKVIISAPADGADFTMVMGVNHEELTADHKVISNGSCTTNCLAPVAYVLHQGIGIERGFMTTIHSYTGDQSLQDTLHSDLRRARAAALSMIPTSTGAARAIGLVMPALKGKLDGTAIRVPTANVSLIDLTFDASRETDAKEVNTLMEEAAKSNRLKGILGINKAPTVSVDFNHDPHSSTFDVTQTQVLDGKFVRVLSWYDNEWGFSNRMVEVAAYYGAMH
jgi:glyceraldehyde 3-phosphate dehydrogenase